MTGSRVPSRKRDETRIIAQRYTCLFSLSAGEQGRREGKAGLTKAVNRTREEGPRLDYRRRDRIS
jgi:hypothetical protein